MNCKNCGKEIEFAKSFIPDNPWRHSEDGMFVCFDSQGNPMRDEDGEYLKAEPKEENKA
jgi:hypothetical protein